jgi:hypothetical protein
VKMVSGAYEFEVPPSVGVNYGWGGTDPHWDVTFYCCGAKWGTGSFEQLRMMALTHVCGHKQCKAAHPDDPLVWCTMEKGHGPVQSFDPDADGDLWEHACPFGGAYWNIQIKCPDDGKCHHECLPMQCFRVRSCAPLSSYGEEWPAEVKRAHGVIVRELTLAQLMSFLAIELAAGASPDTPVTIYGDDAPRPLTKLKMVGDYGVVIE